MMSDNSFIDVTKSRKCIACGLYLNQLPVIDKLKSSKVFWVGLSSVFINDENEKIPLSPNTRTGALIDIIERPFTDEISFYKTNIVKCLPLLNNKIRYPLKHEMEKCYPNFVDELDYLKPKLVFLLGKQVADFVLSKYSKKVPTLDENFEYECFNIDNITFIPVHHPSFILVYRRKLINNYVKGISAIFEKILEPEYV